MRHPLDGNAIAADAHYDQLDPVGNEDGETCNRVYEPDEDALHGHKPNPCQGVMVLVYDPDSIWDCCICPTCGEIGD